MTHYEHESITVGLATVPYSAEKGCWILPGRRPEISKIRATEAAKRINRLIKNSNKEVQLELEVDA